MRTSTVRRQQRQRQRRRSVQQLQMRQYQMTEQRDIPHLVAPASVLRWCLVDMHSSVKGAHGVLQNYQISLALCTPAFSDGLAMSGLTISVATF